MIKDKLYIYIQVLIHSLHINLVHLYPSAGKK